MFVLPPTPSSISLPPSTLYPLFRGVQFVLPTYSRVWGHLLELGGLARDHTLKKTSSPFPEANCP